MKGVKWQEIHGLGSADISAYKSNIMMNGRNKFRFAHFPICLLYLLYSGFLYYFKLIPLPALPICSALARWFCVRRSDEIPWDERNASFRISLFFKMHKFKAGASGACNSLHTNSLGQTMHASARAVNRVRPVSVLSEDYSVCVCASTCHQTVRVKCKLFIYSACLLDRMRTNQTRYEHKQ